MPSLNGRNHSGPAVFTPTGQPSKDRPEAVAQRGDFLTTAQGVRLPDTDHSLKAGQRGPTLLEDFHLREKITHFDHERTTTRRVSRPLGTPQRWSFGHKPFATAPITDNSMVFVGGRNGTVHGLSPSGVQKWSGVAGSRIVPGQELALGDGVLVALAGAEVTAFAD
jgi:catalase/putative pyrroloquinoline-quinone-binding quinoprotein